MRSSWGWCVAPLLPAVACSAAGSSAWEPAPGLGDAGPGGDSAAVGDGLATGDDGTGIPPGDDGASDAGASDAGGPPSGCAQYLGAGSPASAWVYADASGHLQYKALGASGDRIMDFSFAGYMGGGVAIPTVPVAQMVAPSGGDDSAAIQAAIDAVSKLPLQNGVRGAVLLAPGAFTLAGPVAISASGVVLRGSGSGANGTVVTATYQADWLLRMKGSGSATPGATPALITDAYVPSGATSFHVDDATKIAVGDAVLVQRPVTSPWIKFMGMDMLVRDGSAQTWIAPGTLLSSEHVVTSIAGQAVTVDVPLSDSLDAMYVSPPGASVVTFTFPGRITQVGLEDIRFECPLRDATHQFSLLRADSVADGWVRRVAVHNFTEGIWLGYGTKRITVEDVTVTHDATTYVTSEAPFDFTTYGSQTLVHRSTTSGGNKIWYYATQQELSGPNVLLNFTATGTNSHVTAHQRWATGLLVDSATVEGGVTMGNNGSLGSGEGWSMGWGVAWNVVSDVGVMAPPGAMNWAIGVTGAAPPASDNGTYESLNTPVAPKSLYLAQLCERLGPGAVGAIGY
jgi:hypothetical protein